MGDRTWVWVVHPQLLGEATHLLESARVHGFYLDANIPRPIFTSWYALAPTSTIELWDHPKSVPLLKQTSFHHRKHQDFHGAKSQHLPVLQWLKPTRFAIEGHEHKLWCPNPTIADCEVSALSVPQAWTARLQHPKVLSCLCGFCVSKQKKWCESSISKNNAGAWMVGKLLVNYQYFQTIVDPSTSFDYW